VNTGVREPLQWIAAAIVVAGGLSIAWWYQERQVRPPDATRPVARSLMPTPIPAPRFDPRVMAAPDPAATLDGLRGRPVAMLVWTPYAPAASGLLAALDAISLDSEIVPLGLVLYPAREQVAAVCVRYGIRWPQYQDQGRRWLQHLGADSSAPQLVVIDRDGALLHRGRPTPDAWRTLDRLAGIRSARPQRRTVHGRIAWADQPLAGLDAGPPRFWVRDESRLEAARLNVRFDPGTGTFTVDDVPPGAYGISIHIGWVTKGPEQTYGAWQLFGVPTTVPVPEIEVSLQRALHLTEPVDNAVEIEGERLLRHPSPVHFHWDSIAEADRYAFRLSRRQLQSEATAGVEPVLETDLTGTHLELPLEPGWVYELLIDAYRGNQLIARLAGDGAPFSGATYRFTVGQPELEVSKTLSGP